MNTESRRTVHVGANCLFAPPPALEGPKHIEWQGELAERGLEFDQTARAKGGLKLARTREGPFEVRVGVVPPGLGQLLILGAHPIASIEKFILDAEEVVGGLEEVWPGPRQIVARDCTIRHLYFTAGDHAFRNLWEQRFHQSEEDLRVFGRPIGGGGIRLVMPPIDPAQAVVEVKIESFLQDATQLFVETQFVWRSPSELGTPFSVGETVREVEAFATGAVVDFIQKD